MKTMKTIEVTLEADGKPVKSIIKFRQAKNGKPIYYMNGKRISRDKAFEISFWLDEQLFSDGEKYLREAAVTVSVMVNDALETSGGHGLSRDFKTVDEALAAAAKLKSIYRERLNFARVYTWAPREKTIAEVGSDGQVVLKS